MSVAYTIGLWKLIASFNFDMENHLFCQNDYNLPGSSSHAPLSLALTYILL